MRVLCRVFTASLLLGALSAQEAERTPRAFGSRGLAGGAGGIYAERGAGLKRLKAEDAAAGERLEELFAGLDDPGRWFTYAENGTVVDPGAEAIEAVAWTLLALSTSSTMRSGTYRAPCKAATVALTSLMDDAGRLRGAEDSSSDLRCHALVAWALAETGAVSTSRLVSKRAERVAEVLEEWQLEDGSVPVGSEGDTGDLATTAFALHAWRALEPAGEPEAGSPQAKALAWLRERAQPDVEGAPGTQEIEAARLLWTEDQLLREMFTGEQIGDLPASLPPLDGERLARWRGAPELRLAALTVARALPEEFWLPVWRAARDRVAASDLDEATIRDRALQALELSTPYRYATRR